MTNRGETITMVDDEGLPHDFTLIDVVEVDDRRYAVLQPEDQEAGAVLFRVEGDTMAPVEDDAEFDKVVDVLRGLDEYDDLIIEDGDDEPVAEDEDHGGRDLDEDEVDDEDDAGDEEDDDGEEEGAHDDDDEEDDDL